MSKGMVCDNCGTVLALNDRGEADSGEDAAWLHIKVGTLAFDVCTRSCAHQILAADEVVSAIEAWQQIIAEIAQTISDDREDETHG